MVGGLVIMRNNDSLISKLDLLCTEDYKMVETLINRLASGRKTSDRFKEMRDKCQETGNKMTMEEIDEEIQAYRRGE